MPLNWGIFLCANSLYTFVYVCISMFSACIHPYADVYPCVHPMSRHSMSLTSYMTQCAAQPPLLAKLLVWEEKTIKLDQPKELGQKTWGWHLT